MPVFHKIDGKLKKLNLLPLAKERALQELIQNNLLEILDIEFLASEYQTTDRGRIDTLAIDLDGAPVIIEYKKSRNDNVINQALSYLKWLKSQKTEFLEMMVIKKLGREKLKPINWNNTRIICIAESYSKYDIDTLEVIPLKLELYTYRYYENDIFTLEKVNSEEEKAIQASTSSVIKEIVESEKKTIEISLETHLNKGQPFVRQLFSILQDRIFLLDESIEEKINNNYIAFKVSKIFAEVHIQKSKLLLYLRPISYSDPEERLYKVPDSYNWVLDRRVYINSEADIDYVMNLVEQSYKDIL